MSSSSPEGSPNSALCARTFSMSREKFNIDIPSPRLQLLTNGNGNGLNSPHLSSPKTINSPNGRRFQNFTREGILGSAHKARNLSQSSGDRESIANSILRQNGNNTDDGINPLKRRSTDAGLDYPRRRATIAVGHSSPSRTPLTSSAKYVVPENQDAMETSPSASSAPSWEQNVSIESLESNLTLATN